MDAIRVQGFSESEQLLMVGAELMRASRWQKEDKENFLGALERTLALIDFMISDPKWRERTRMLLGLREETARFYAGEAPGDVLELYRAL